METSLIEQFIYPKKGPGQLYEKMAEEIVHLGGEILYGRTVNKITLQDGKVATVSALKAENAEFASDGVSFDLLGERISLGIPGEFSVYNALCAIGIQ